MKNAGKLKSRLFFERKVFFSLFVLLTCYCNRNPSGIEYVPSGSLELRVQITNSLQKTAAEFALAFDSLVIEVNSLDFDTIIKRKIDIARPVIMDTIAQIPVGNNRKVKISTINKGGLTVHTDSTGIKTVNILANTLTSVSANLVSALGSIYLQIGGIPTNVDSIFAAFKSLDGKVWEVHVARSAKTFLSIDGIPHLTEGTLFVAAIHDSVTIDTLHYAMSNLTFNARKSTTVNMDFQSIPGKIGLNISLRIPDVTVVNIGIDEHKGATTESGELIITEIMYAATNEEYVEVYNTTTAELFYDTLIIDVDDDSRKFSGIRIGAGNFYVFGRKTDPKLSWVDTFHTVASVLDLSSTGNWITIKAKNLSVIDQVVFTGGKNCVEWPYLSEKKSVVLDTLAYSTAYNNFGRNWKIAETLITGSTTQYGSPHGK
jgi:hypothetical protein